MCLGFEITEFEHVSEDRDAKAGLRSKDIKSSDARCRTGVVRVIEDHDLGRNRYRPDSGCFKRLLKRLDNSLPGTPSNEPHRCRRKGPGQEVASDQREPDPSMMTLVHESEMRSLEPNHLDVSRANHCISGLAECNHVRDRS